MTWSSCPRTTSRKNEDRGRARSFTRQRRCWDLDERLTPSPSFIYRPRRPTKVLLVAWILAYAGRMSTGPGKFIQSISTAHRVSHHGIDTVLVAPLGLFETDHPRAVGPVALIAHVLPISVPPGELPQDVDVRPHPHIGVAALSYMLDGHLTHRDSLGSRQELGPGDIGYLVAGRGAVHSERFARLRVMGGTVSVMQILLALPEGSEDIPPSFTHLAVEDRIESREAGCVVRVLLGNAGDLASPLRFPTPVFMHDVQLLPGGEYAAPDLGEGGIYVLEGELTIGDALVRAQQRAIFSGGQVTVRSESGARLLAFGGEPVGPRYMWWNFVHSSLHAIDAAKAEWRGGRMKLPDGDTESFTPAPPDDARKLYRLNGDRITGSLAG